MMKSSRLPVSSLIFRGFRASFSTFKAPITSWVCFMGVLYAYSINASCFKFHLDFVSHEALNIKSQIKPFGVLSHARC